MADGGLLQKADRSAFTTLSHVGAGLGEDAVEMQEIWPLVQV